MSNPLKKSPAPGLIRRLARVPMRDQFTSSITVGEILYGAPRTGKPETYLARIETNLLPKINVLDFDGHAARAYARIRGELELKGMRLDDPDLRIAAIALNRGLTLVTGNIKHFSHIEGLKVENWLDE